MKAGLRTCGLLVVCGFAEPAFCQPTWEKQAERLQKISATLLDAVPVGEPAPKGGFAIGLQSIISGLPEPDPTVGGKSEKVPTSPVHVLPTLNLSARPFGGAFAMGIWAGGLAPGGESLVGLKAKLSQNAAGARFEVRFNAGSGTIFLPVLFQVGSATLKGPIASEESDDKFTTKSTIWAVTPGYTLDWLWLNFLVGGKSTTSKFEIEEDQTSLEFTDNLSDALLPFMVGASIGVQFGSFVIGGGQLFVPDRLYMPRVLLAYREEL